MALGSLTSSLLLTRSMKRKVKHGSKCVTNVYYGILSTQQPPQFVNKAQKLHTLSLAMQSQPCNINPSCALVNFRLVPSQKYSTSPTPESSDNKQEESIDDLRSLLKDKSLGLTQKFKIVFQQYGVVAVCVHLVNTAFWVSIIYTALSQ